MLFGAANDGEMVLATPRARARCPGCGADLRPKCGAAKKQVWHWAHLAADCDPWHEGEGEWHLSWKSRAPKDCTEVAIGPHRADIRTREGLVIELQASTIDAIEIAAREAFYDRMIWLLDGRTWRSSGHFRFARGLFPRCEACTTELPGGMLRTRGGCAVCDGARVLDRKLGDRYLWDRRRRSFDNASRPVYVDTGENVVLLKGSPSRYGSAEVISYLDFCAAHGLAWDPMVDGEAARPEREDSLPDFAILPPPAASRMRPPRCPSVEMPPEPQEGVRAKISIDGVRLEDVAVDRQAGSFALIAVRLREQIERASCGEHPARARVEVAFHGGRPGWAIHNACCTELSQKIVASLTSARLQLRSAVRAARAAASKTAEGENGLRKS